jgi:hypothetical protein
LSCGATVVGVEPKILLVGGAVVIVGVEPKRLLAGEADVVVVAEPKGLLADGAVAGAELKLRPELDGCPEV